VRQKPKTTQAPSVGVLACVRVVGPSDYLTTIYIEGVKITTQLRKRICTHTHRHSYTHTQTNTIRRCKMRCPSSAASCGRKSEPEGTRQKCVFDATIQRNTNEHKLLNNAPCCRGIPCGTAKILLIIRRRNLTMSVVVD
jgi:hypothetical protein